MQKIRPEFYVNLKGKILAKLRESIRYTAYGCWEWDGGRYPRGYGKMRIGRKSPESYAHRWSYLLFRGEIGEGLEIDHLCRNPCCVNPDHLEAVTHQVNTARGIGGQRTGERQRAKTHCRNGHEFRPENTYVNPQGHRSCRECHRAGARSYYWRNPHASNQG